MTALQARLVDPSLPPALIVVVQLSNYLDIQNAFGSGSVTNSCNASANGVGKG